MDSVDREEILASLEWNGECVSPSSFAHKHAISNNKHAIFKRSGLRSRASQSPEEDKKGASSSSSSIGASASKRGDMGAGKGKANRSAHRAGVVDSQEGARKRPKVDEDDEEDKGEREGTGKDLSLTGALGIGSMSRSAHEFARKVAIPSYLRSRFGDKASAIGDAPPTPSTKGNEGAGSGEECSEGDYNEAIAQMQDERSRRNTATRRRHKNKDVMQADNNILLFGQWYRKKHNVQGEEPAPRKPEMSDLRAFVLDRNAYWGDEIALRVFADAFKIVVCVVLQVEERLQVVFPPSGGAQSLFYVVLTHRGAVPHYRSVSVGDRHVLPLEEISNLGADGLPYVTRGMVARLWEDCPQGWDKNLTPQALAFFMGRTQTKMATVRHAVVRNAQTLREVKSGAAIEEQCSAGTAIQSWVIDGFPAGTGFVERIVCSRNETNPCFTISKTPGDGDCLFYSMIDVATEMLRDHPPPGPVNQLRQMVSESLTEQELAFFNAANNFV